MIKILHRLSPFIVTTALFLCLIPQAIHAAVPSPGVNSNFRLQTIGLRAVQVAIQTLDWSSAQPPGISAVSVIRHNSTVEIDINTNQFLNEDITTTYLSVGIYTYYSLSEVVYANYPKIGYIRLAFEVSSPKKMGVKNVAKTLVLGMSRNQFKKVNWDTVKQGILVGAFRPTLFQEFYSSR